MAPASTRTRLPAGRVLDLPGRGRTFFRQIKGPEGAPTVLLLHGWTVTADLNWFSSYGALGEHFRTIAIDHRGHGRGIRSWRPFRLEDCADDAAALVRALGLDRVVLVGYSMGGAVAQLLWRRHRDLVAGLVLCATSRSFSARDPRSQLWFSGLLGMSVAARLAPGVLMRGLSGNVIRRRTTSQLDEWGRSELERNDPATVLRAGWALGRFRSHDWIGSVDVPTAVVVPTHDQVVSPRHQLGLAKAIPGATVHEVEGGHTACATQPDHFVPVLVGACHEVAARAQHRPRGVGS